MFNLVLSTKSVWKIETSNVDVNDSDIDDVAFSNLVRASRGKAERS